MTVATPSPLGIVSILQSGQMGFGFVAWRGAGAPWGASSLLGAGLVGGRRTVGLSVVTLLIRVSDVLNNNASAGVFFVRLVNPARGKGVHRASGNPWSGADVREFELDVGGRGGDGFDVGDLAAHVVAGVPGGEEVFAEREGVFRHTYLTGYRSYSLSPTLK